MGKDFLTFFILDVYDSVFQNNSNYSLVASTSNVFIDAIVWDTRSGYIRQDQMMCLEREGLLEPVTHIDVDIV